jgi:ketosteroid isomerase-like protein
VLADDYVVHDHRLARLGVIEGAEVYVDSAVSMWELAPNVEIEGAVLRRDRHGSVSVTRTFGTLAEGGTFENLYVSVTIVERGRVARSELFEPEDVDAALARFAELRPDPLRIPSNSATRAAERFWECIDRRDWDALRDLCAPIVWEDRRRLIRTTGDRDLVIANCKLISRAGSVVSRTLLATAGDRLQLHRLAFTGPLGGPIFDTEVLDLIEVDSEGRVVALITIDPDDRRAASLEMLERHARSDEARGVPAAAFDVLRGVNAHDLERVGATLRDDFVMNDHRRAGLGRLEKADYLASLAALFEEAPDVSVETLYIVAVEPHGVLMVARNFGTLREGGEFESPYVRIMLHRDGRLAAVEMFELEDLDAARARF